MVEVTAILRSADDSGHGGDVETEETTANDGNGCDEVDVTDLIHLDDVDIGGRSTALGGGGETWATEEAYYVGQAVLFEGPCDGRVTRWR